MNTFKKTGGFTLVELIIVIAILAILSSVAVAGYSSYITKANNSAVETFLNNISTAATLANAKVGEVAKIEVAVETAEGDNKGKLKVTISGDLDEKDFEDDFEAALSDFAGGTLAPSSEAGKDSYVAYVTAPSAWAGSEYANTTAVWEGSWPKP